MVLAVTGAELQAAVVDEAHLLGWAAVHFRPARTAHGWRTAVQYDGKGWPDLILVRERLLVAEIKGDRDRLSPEQTRWVELLTLAAVEVHVWTTDSWRNGTVDACLAHTHKPARMTPHP